MDNAIKSIDERLKKLENQMKSSTEENKQDTTRAVPLNNDRIEM